jgi:hypothetical protein
MGVDPLTAGLVGGAALGGLSFVQAGESNQASKRAAGQQKAANIVAANQQKENLARDFAQLEGSLRTTSAARGTAGSATSFGLQTTVGAVATGNRANINTNTFLGNAQADQRASASYQSPLFGALSGGLQGFLLGSSLASVFPASGGIGGVAGSTGTYSGFAPTGLEGGVAFV